MSSWNRCASARVGRTAAAAARCASRPMRDGNVALRGSAGAAIVCVGARWLGRRTRAGSVATGADAGPLADAGRRGAGYAPGSPQRFDGLGRGRGLRGGRGEAASFVEIDHSRRRGSSVTRRECHANAVRPLVPQPARERDRELPSQAKRARRAAGLAWRGRRQSPVVGGGRWRVERLPSWGSPRL